MIRKLAVIFLIQMSFILSLDPTASAQSKTTLECLNIGKVTVSPDFTDREGGSRGSILLQGRTYPAMAYNKGNGMAWYSNDKKIEILSDHWGIGVTVNGKKYECHNLDNLISVSCANGRVQTQDATYQRITKERWRDLTHNVTLNNLSGTESTSQLQVIYQLRCNK